MEVLRTDGLIIIKDFIIIDQKVIKSFQVNFRIIYINFKIPKFPCMSLLKMI